MEEEESGWKDFFLFVMLPIFIIQTFAPDVFTDFTMTVEDYVSRVGVGIVKIAVMFLCLLC